jgi:serine O-acetyltransferase
VPGGPAVRRPGRGAFAVESLWRLPARPAVRAIGWIRGTAVDIPQAAWRWMPLPPWGGQEVPARTGTVARRPGGYLPQPAWYGWAEARLTPAAWAVGSYRASHWLWMHGLPSAALLASLPARIASGADLHPQARIGRRFRLVHGFGVVVGETAEVGDDCMLLQGVTLGVRHAEDPAPLGVRVHPRLGDRVCVGAGAVLLGPITIGDDVRIGANSVVLGDVPSGATAVGAPARILPCGEQRSAARGVAELLPGPGLMARTGGEQEPWPPSRG